MLGGMLWGAVAPLVWCGCMCSVPAWSLVCCSRMYDEEGTVIIYFLGPDSLQWFHPCFYLLWLCACQRLLYIFFRIIVQLIWDWNGGWEIFLDVLLGLINYAVGSGLVACMTLWMSWLFSNWLSFLMAPMCKIFLTRHLDSVLCILSRLLGHLRVVVLGFEY